jgi:hypothetical protein
MTTKRMFCVLLVFLAVPAWAGSMGLEIGSGGSLSFKQRTTATPIWGSGNFDELGLGKNSFAAFGNFSFHTGRLTNVAPNAWTFGAGGNLVVRGCVDLNADGDSARHCDKNDVRGKLFTGVFENAKITKIGKNTYKLNGEVMLTPTGAAATQLGLTTNQFLAHLSIRFTDTCSPSSLPTSCKVNITSGQLVAPEPSAFVLLAFGMLLAGLGHTTLQSFFQPHV